MTESVLLTARQLEWRAGERTILGPLDLDVRRGECLAVVGSNGAGKTTLLRLLTGLLRPSGGELRYGDRPYTALSRRELARRIAYVPQIRASRVPLKVEEVVLLGRYPHLSRMQIAPRAADFAAVEEALAVVGGERQAVYIAAALAQQSELLVLDEPTLHLDARHQHDLAGLLLRLKSGADRTVVLATHDLNLASLLGDRLLALVAGVPLACGPPAEIVNPDLLDCLFQARFEIVRGGERPVTVLDLGA